MRVAVVTPYYKEPREWIERCIASVAAQTHACLRLGSILLPSAETRPRSGVPIR